MSTILIHRRKELHGSPTKLLLHRPPGPGQDEALQPLQIEAPKKRKRSKREMLVERIREQAEEIARLMIKLDNAETMSSEFEGRGGAGMTQINDLDHSHSVTRHRVGRRLL